MTHTVDTKFQFSPDQYFPEEFEKRQIYLHHTVGGTAFSTYNYWNDNEERVGTAFIIDRPGTIYQVFKPEFWCHHLGLNHPRNKEYNQHSIGIEIASWGALRAGWELNDMLSRAHAPVRFDDDYLYACDIDPAPGKQPSLWFRGARRTYHIIADQLKFIDLPSPTGPFRTYIFFDAYTNAQVEAANWLIPHLCKQFPSIPTQLIPNEDKLIFDMKLLDFRGVLTHANVRQDKSDLSPAWDWSLTQLALAKPTA